MPCVTSIAQTSRSTGSPGAARSSGFGVGVTPTTVPGVGPSVATGGSEGVGVGVRVSCGGVPVGFGVSVGFGVGVGVGGGLGVGEGEGVGAVTMNDREIVKCGGALPPQLVQMLTRCVPVVAPGGTLKLTALSPDPLATNCPRFTELTKSR